MNRWNELTEMEKRIAFLIAAGKKEFAIYSELGISRNLFTASRKIIYRILQVQGQTELALEMGKHWAEIQPKGIELKRRTA